MLATIERHGTIGDGGGFMLLANLLSESALFIRLHPGWKLSTSADGRAWAIVTVDGREVPVAHPVPHYAAAVNRLKEGSPLAQLRDLVVASGGEWHWLGFLKLLESLHRSGAFEFPVVDHGRELAVIVPQWPSYSPALAAAAPPADRVPDRFACLHRVDRGWLLESPLCGARVLMPCLAALDTPLVRRAVAAIGFLESAQPEADPRGEALRQWEFHDLLFHVHQRKGWHRDAMGAHFPFMGEIDPLPARRPGWRGERIALARATASADHTSFAAVLQRRQSLRHYNSSHPVSIGDLGALLDRAARIRSRKVVPIQSPTGQAAPVELSWRPSPSAGASHPLEIYPLVACCDGLEPGMYHYDANDHVLVHIPAAAADIAKLVAEARRAAGDQCNPQVVLLIAARFARTLWKYRAIGYGNILRDTGALYQTLYLAATELGLAPCAVGNGNSALFARITGLDPLVEGTVGEFLIGAQQCSYG